MKDTLGLIPQVFYDLIGRVVPGAATLIAGSVLLKNGDYAAATLSIIDKQSAVVLSVLLASALLTCYLLSLLLGAIGFAITEDRSQALAPLATIEPKPPAVIDPASYTSYIYDFILLRDAGTGGRLAKLRAEIHLCRVLIAACIGLGALYLLENVWRFGSRGSWIVLISLAVGAAAARFLPVGLAVRVWALLRKLDPKTFRRRMLMAGCFGLGVVYGISLIIDPEIRRLWIVLISLAATGGASYLLHAHLAIRSRLLMVNCWTILKLDERSLVTRRACDDAQGPKA